MKFNPKRSPQSNAQAHTDTKRMGVGMMISAMIIGLALLTYVFQTAIDKQYNPNQTIQSSQTADNSIEITLKRNRSGHYVGTGHFNDKKAIFLLDTGATYVAIPERYAKLLGLKKGRQIQLSTANGPSIGYQTNIDKLSIGAIHLYNVQAVITANLDEILLGMSVLRQLEFTQRGDTLTIRQYL